MAADPRRHRRRPRCRDRGPGRPPPAGPRRRRPRGGPAGGRARRDRRGAPGSHRRHGRRRPLPGDDRGAVGRPRVRGRGGGHRAGGDRPSRRVHGHLLPTGLQRPPAGDRAPGLAGPPGPMAAAGGRRRGHHQHRDHRTRCRIGGPGDAHRPQAGRPRRLAARRLQELLDAGPCRIGRAGVVPVARRRGCPGDRGGHRPHGPGGGLPGRAPSRHGHPRRHRVRDRLRRRGHHRGGRAAGRGPVLERAVQAAPLPPQPRAVRQRRHVRGRRPGCARTGRRVHAGPGGRRASHRRPPGAPVEVGRHGRGPRGSPPAAGPGGAPGRTGGHPAGPGDGHGQDRRQPGRQVRVRRGHPDPRRATATAASTRWSGPTGTSGACASGPAPSRPSATTSAPVWHGAGPPRRPAGSLPPARAGIPTAPSRAGHLFAAPLSPVGTGFDQCCGPTGGRDVVRANTLVYREAPLLAGAGRGTAVRPRDRRGRGRRAARGSTVAVGGSGTTRYQMRLQKGDP